MQNKFYLNKFVDKMLQQPYFWSISRLIVIRYMYLCILILQNSQHEITINSLEHTQQMRENIMRTDLKCPYKINDNIKSMTIVVLKGKKPLVSNFRLNRDKE